jgi:hypothetical protein
LPYPANRATDDFGGCRHRNGVKADLHGAHTFTNLADVGKTIK